MRASGYCSIKIRGSFFYVHRVVAMTFRGPPPDGSTWQVHHRDGNPSNNRLDNVEYVTQSQNTLASYASPFRRCGGAQLSVPVMWRALGAQSWTTSPSRKQAAAELGVSVSSIKRASRDGKSAKGYEFQLAHTGEVGTLDGEEWRQMCDPMSGLEVPGRMVSSLGRIKSKHGKVSWGTFEKVGYCKVTITTRLRTRTELVHRLVAFAFKGPPPSRECSVVNHKDLNKLNNAADNLEYVSYSENMTHFHAHVRSSMSMPGTLVEARCLDSSDVWTRHRSIRSAARALGISAYYISACANGHKASACGYEFKLADASPAPNALPGEEWRCIDFAALLREKVMRTGS